jgi:hypothetical protein
MLVDRHSQLLLQKSERFCQKNVVFPLANVVFPLAANVEVPPASEMPSNHVQCSLLIAFYANLPKTCGFEKELRQTFSH